MRVRNTTEATHKVSEHERQEENPARPVDLTRVEVDRRAIRSRFDDLRLFGLLRLIFCFVSHLNHVHFAKFFSHDAFGDIADLERLNISTCARFDKSETSKVIDLRQDRVLTPSQDPVELRRRERVVLDERRENKTFS